MSLINKADFFDPSVKSMAEHGPTDMGGDGNEHQPPAKKGLKKILDFLPYVNGQGFFIYLFGS